MDFQRGSEWRKWDLHVHTPSSMVQEYIGQTVNEKWENFISDLEALPAEFKVLGINDYLFIEGYEKVLEYRRAGRLKNIHCIFPVLEFRIKKFAGNKHFKRVNYHVIFSNELPVNTIKQQFLNQLYGNYTLAPEADGINWQGFITEESLVDLGKAIKSGVPEDKLVDYDSDLVEGFNNINFDEEKLYLILSNSTYLKDKFLTAIGKTEWDAFSWDDNSIAEKKTVINDVDFVFTSSKNLNNFNRAKNKLVEQKVNSLLLDCSDAHRNSNSTNKDRIGKCFTWVNSDPSFSGLKQIINEPDRLSVAGNPPLLDRLTTAPNKFIKSIAVRRVQNSSMAEVWYEDILIPTNPSLVAIIGNKGNGKSALTDIIGLVANSHNENYSFLTKTKFKSPRPYNRAANIEAKITWYDDSDDGYIRLDALVDKNKPEKVKYIPQNFLEKLCGTDDNSFEEEIKKIIFTHTDDSQKMGYSHIDELINYKSEIINKELSTIKGEIDLVNQKIIILEKKKTENYKKTLNENLQSKEKELEHFRTNPPTLIQEPASDPLLETKNKELHIEIQKLKLNIEQKSLFQNQLITDRSRLVIEITDLEKSLQSLKAVELSIKGLVLDQTDVLKKYGIDINQVLSFDLNTRELEKPLSTKKDELSKANLQYSGTEPEFRGINWEISEANDNLKLLEQKLDEPHRLYQKYLKDHAEWEARCNNLIGDKNSLNTIEFLKDQIDYIEKKINSELNSEYLVRGFLIERLYDKKEEINFLYVESYKPITEFIKRYGHLMKDYAINLSVEFTLDGFVQKFFDHISQGAKGTYIGIEEGNKYLNEMIPLYNFNEIESVHDFLTEIRDSLFIDKRSDQNNAKREAEKQLKSGYTIEDLYKFLYHLDYLKPTFKLNLGTKSLSELSPGERGALLLIFYLFLDKDDKPLIIDQPEENLDNQSVYKYLVHFIKEAKKRRQIIIVTHNPNLAVVCDAEQIIHMKIDKVDHNRVSFVSGSIENGTLNKTLVDILEGTKPAIKNRISKYALATG